jgi:hypothetical protein
MLARSGRASSFAHRLTPGGVWTCLFGGSGVAGVATSSSSVDRAITGSSTAAPLVVCRRARPLAGVLAPVIRAALKVASTIETDSGCIASDAAFA